MTFADLKNRHAGESVYVLGTGPSLDLALPLLRSSAVPRICINFAVCAPGVVVPGRTYWAAVDYQAIEALGGRVPAGALYVAPHHTRRNCLERCAIDCDFSNAVFYKKLDCSAEPVPTDRDEAARLGALYSCMGTVTGAASLAWFMGAAEVVFAGVDGGGGRAECISSWYPTPEPEHNGRTAFTTFRQSAERVLRCTGTPFRHIQDFKGEDHGR